MIKNLYIISGCNGAGKTTDYWAIYDNTMRHRQKIASGRRGSDSDIFDEEQYRNIKKYVR